MENRYDIVIFGATGFTGKHAIEPAHKLCLSEGLTVGVAGRSYQKLKAALYEVEKRTGLQVTKLPILVADVSDEKSLQEMTKKAKVVLNCCGPYLLYGEPVVKACLATRTHYVDVTAESLFMDKMLLKYGEEAKKKGVYIVNACGIDCVPSDMGVVFLQTNFPGTLNSVEIYGELLCDGKHVDGPHYNVGTWNSLIHHLATIREQMKLSRMTEPKDIPALKYGPKFRYLTLNYFDAERTPTEEEILRWEFRVTLFGQGWADKAADPGYQFASEPDQKIVGTISGRNPGYGATCVMAVLCSKMLITEVKQLPKVGGVYTAGAAFANTSLIRQLVKNGVNFEILPDSSH